MEVPGCEGDMTPHYSGLGVCVWYVALEGRGFRDARCLMN